MRFFKFVDKDGRSINSAFKKISYIKGETIKVNANPDNQQCGTGIHCIIMDSDNPIRPDNIMFGPSVAILEADEKDIVYYNINGKCRLKKCKVIDVYEIDKLPEDIKLGRGDMYFALKVLNQLPTISLTKAWRDIAKHYPLRFTNKLDKYYRDFEDMLVYNDFIHEAVKYSVIHKQYNNKKIKEYVDKELQDEYCIFDIAILKWINIFEPENIEITERRALEYFDSNIWISTEELMVYSIEYNRDFSDLFVKRIKCYCLDIPSDDTICNYIKKFKDNPKVMELAETNPIYAMAFCKATKTKATPEMKEILNGGFTGTKYVLEVDNDEDMYHCFDTFSKIVAYCEKYGNNDKNFLSKVLSSYSITNDMVKNLSDFTKYRNIVNAEYFDKIFIKTHPYLTYCIDYLYHINSSSKEVINHIHNTFSLNTVIEVMNMMGHMSLFEQILDAYEYEYNLTSIYFKVLYLLNNGTKVSPEVTKESGMRKVYQNAGKNIEVDEGMVFDNIFSALSYKEYLLSLDYHCINVFRCTGDNFVKVDEIGKWNNKDNLSKELKGSGFLQNIKITGYPNQVYYPF